MLSNYTFLSIIIVTILIIIMNPIHLTQSYLLTPPQLRLIKIPNPLVLQLTAPLRTLPFLPSPLLHPNQVVECLAVNFVLWEAEDLELVDAEVKDLLGCFLLVIRY